MDNLTIEMLYSRYEYQMKKLVRINEKRDFTAKGDAEFQRQNCLVELAKIRLIAAQNAQYQAAK